jgi:hypothetical protein
MRAIGLMLYLILSLFASGAWAQETGLSADAIRNFEDQSAALDGRKAELTEVQKKINISIVLYLHESILHDMTPVLPRATHGVILTKTGEILVDIKANVSDSLLAAIREQKGTVINAFPRYNSIRARIPIVSVESIAAHPDIIFIDRAAGCATNKLTTSEGDVAHNCPLVRARNYTGKGVKVGVLSDSVDNLAKVQASGDLPQNVTVLQDDPGNSGEGTAMLEIIYDLAPDASLCFATANDSASNFANNIIALQKAGCKIIVDDVTYFNESPFQDGVIAQAVNTVVNAGAFYFSCAGNYGNKHSATSGTWEGDYVDSNSTSPVTHAHDFGGGVTGNQILSNPGNIILDWSDPLGGSSNDYGLYVVDGSGNIVGYSDNPQTGQQDPYEYVCAGSCGNNYTNDFVVIKRNTGAQPRFLHLVVLKGKLQVATSGTTFGHNAAENAFSLGAVSAAGRTSAFTGTQPVENFSSDGPRKVFYDPKGNPYTPGNVSSTGGKLLNKPDFIAADGVKCSAPGFNPFYGTSAAAPHAAAIAALLVSSNPNISHSLLSRALSYSTLPSSSAWNEYSGYNIIMADRALSYYKAASSLTPLQILLLGH